ncbi:MAG: porin [Thiotrichaceae bacterium]|nr:porin [Thiotrichaceae bacterium]
MKQNILAIAVAAIVVAPMAANADVTLSGLIQAEIVGEKDASTNYDYISRSQDSGGAVFNGGNNRVAIRFDEKLGGGLKAFGAYEAAFNTSVNSGFTRREAYVGLKGAVAHVRLGTIAGAYKNSLTVVDPFAGTSLQGRGTGGGMSGGRLGHSNFLDNVVEVGVNSGGFGAQFQWTADQKYSPADGAKTYEYTIACDTATPPTTGCSKQNGAGLVELKYDGKIGNKGHWGLFGAAAYTDVKQISTDSKKSDGNRNWKVGGSVSFANLTLAGQYENVQIAQNGGTLDGNRGKYGILSLDYRIGNVSLDGWVAKYKSDNNITVSSTGNDAMSFAVGGKYHFSKRTNAYLGYRKTDSDSSKAGGTDKKLYDQDAVVLGVIHKF